MANITLLYYTCNRISEFFAWNVRKHLIEVANGRPIISVSQVPISFGENICVDSKKPTRHGVWEQILAGVEAAKTKYIACCEDDTLYVHEHFDYEPKNGFAYNLNHWHLCRGVYFYRGHRAMLVCVVARELMLETIHYLYKNHSDNLDIKLWDLPKEEFRTEIPVITFRHQNSLDGVPKIPAKYPIKTELPYWGNSERLWADIYE